MFVGAINSTLRAFLAHSHRSFDGARVIVGCSGNFTSEATLTQFAAPAEIHANDVSFYSCLVGRWLAGDPLPFEIAGEGYDWLRGHMTTDARAVASVMVLLDMLQYEKRNNPHRVRMWDNYLAAFGDLVDKTLARLESAEIRVASFWAGDVMEHFARFGDDPDCVFCCYAPTYASGYERMYKRLDEIVDWERPTYPLLDDQRRAGLLAWMSQRRYLWYDDRLLDGREPVLKQERGRSRTVYLYSNVVDDPALFAAQHVAGLPRLPLAPSTLEITPDSTIAVRPITTSDLSRFKDAYLGKAIKHAPGTWAFAVYVDGWVVGFFEFANPKVYGAPSELYLQADFPVSGTRYARLSKLIVMLVVSGETARTMTRLKEYRVRAVSTTAFTDKPVSMKYRGVLDLVKRGETAGGQKFLNYGQTFNDLTWQETLEKWLSEHGSKRS